MERDNKGRFMKGSTGWNKGKKGYTNNGSFKKGHKVYEGTEQTRFKKGHKTWSFIDGRSKHPINRKMVKGVALSHLVYCSQPYNFYRVPQGMVIHHIDLDPNNNSPNNLVMIPDRDHRVLHNHIYKTLLKGGDS